MKEILLARAAEAGLELSAEQADLCQAFSALLLDYNQRMNLTALVTPEDLAVKHFVDSFSCLRIGAWPQGARVVDVGTGAGFPGIPLAILRPDLRLVLADALKKRIEFLQHAVAELGLRQVECVHGRAEELGRKAGMRDSFDVAVARAVARLPVLLEYGLPLVRKGGGFLAMKGPDVEEEIKAAARAADLLGAGAAETVSFELPAEAGRRTLVWYPKNARTPAAYPRRPGMPACNPL